LLFGLSLASRNAWLCCHHAAIFHCFNSGNVIQIWKPFFRIFLDYSCLRIGMPVVWQCRRTRGSTGDYRVPLLTGRNTEQNNTTFSWLFSR